MKTVVEDKVAFGARLRQVISAMWPTQWAASVQLEAQPAQLSKYLSGQSAPSLPFLLKLAEHGVNVQYLLTGHGNPFDADTDAGRHLIDRQADDN